MNRIDVAIVRFLPFVLYILIGVCTTLIICGKDIGEFYLIHGNSAIINYVDARWCVIPDEKTYVIMFNVMYLATAMWTAVMAIRHFRRTRNNKNKAYGNDDTDTRLGA